MIFGRHAVVEILKEIKSNKKASGSEKNTQMNARTETNFKRRETVTRGKHKSKQHFVQNKTPPFSQSIRNKPLQTEKWEQNLCIIGWIWRSSSGVKL